MEGFRKLADDCERVIEKDDSSSFSTSSDYERGPRSCRQKTMKIVMSTQFQIVIISLVILDCLVVIAELLLDLRFLEVQAQDKNAADDTLPKIFHYISLSILSLFVVEMLFKIYALRLELFKLKMEIFDAFVIVICFTLDIVFANSEGVQAGIGLLIILRLWRVSRILKGVIMSVKNNAERRVARERAAKSVVEEELSKYRKYSEMQDNYIDKLTMLLQSHGIKYDPMIGAGYEAPVASSTINVIAEVNQVE